MQLTDYAWTFSSGKLKNEIFQIVHTDFKKFLNDLQTSAFWHAASYFNILVRVYYNSKYTFAIQLDTDKFTFKDIISEKAISLERVQYPIVSIDAIIQCCEFLKKYDADPKYDSLIKELKEAL